MIARSVDLKLSFNHPDARSAHTRVVEPTRISLVYVHSEVRGKRLEVRCNPKLSTKTSSEAPSSRIFQMIPSDVI